MAIREGLFDVIVFGLLFVSPFVDHWLANAHRYLTGAFSASVWALLAYMSMWEICRRSPLRRYRSLESLATALAASTVGLVFCLRGHDSPLVVLVLSIGLMMGALMAAIAVVACFLDWKLTAGEWAFAGFWCVASAAGIGYVTFVKTPAAVAAVTQGQSPFKSQSAQEQAILFAAILLAALLAGLLIKQPKRFMPTIGLLVTVAFAIGWGWLCSQGVLLATEVGTAVPMMVGIGLAAWMALRLALPTDTSVPSDAPGATPALIWLGPFALTLYHVFDLPRIVPVVVDISSSDLPAAADSQVAEMAAETVEPLHVEETSTSRSEPAPIDSTPVLESVVTPAPAAESASPPLPGQSAPSPRPPFGIILPGRLAERLFAPAVAAALLNLYIVTFR